MTLSTLDASQVRERLGRLQLAIAQNPGAAVAAHGGLGANAFQAAIAEPPA